MKKYSYLFFISTLINACSSDFIDLSPPSQALVKNFYKTTNDFKIAVNTAYDILQDNRLYGDRFETILEIRSDNGKFNDQAKNSGEKYQIDRFEEAADNSQIEDVYVALYDGINRTNIVLDRIDDTDIATSIRESLKGEAQFIRALLYFHLVRLYGPVPLIKNEITPEEAGDYVREDLETVYAFIQTDLTAATAALPINQNDEDLGRATKGAAMGLLAKVYLTQKKYVQAKEQLENVIGLDKYDLLSEIESVFDANNEMNDEILFAVRYLKGAGGEGRSLAFDYTADDTIEQNLLDAYDSTDKRLPLVEYVNVSSNRRVPLKYSDDLSLENNVGTDIPVLRYADILLMYAEVLNEEAYVNDYQSPAFRSLNLVRNRAGMPSYYPDDLSDQALFRTAVLKERRLELALEFHRWYDLLRTDTAMSTFADLDVTLTTCDLLYPLPKIAIDRADDPINFPQNQTCD